MCNNTKNTQQISNTPVFSHILFSIKSPAIRL